MEKINSIVGNFATTSRYGRPFAFARTFLGLGTLLTLLTNDSSALFKAGIKPNFGQSLVPINFFNIFIELPAPYIFWGKLIAIVVLLLVISGWRPRFTCIPHFYIAACFLNASLDIDGGDQITSNLTLLLIPICLMDNRKSHWDADFQEKQISEYIAIRNIIANFTFLICRLQMCVIYLHAFTGKLIVPEWINGSAIYYWSHHPMFGSANGLLFILDFVEKRPILLFLANWGILLLELILAVGLVLNKRHYKRLFYFGVSLHFGIILIHGLVSFFFAMTGGLILYFLVDYYAIKKDIQVQLKEGQLVMS